MTRYHFLILGHFLGPLLATLAIDFSVKGLLLGLGVGVTGAMAYMQDPNAAKAVPVA